MNITENSFVEAVGQYFQFLENYGFKYLGKEGELPKDEKNIWINTIYESKDCRMTIGLEHYTDIVIQYIRMGVSEKNNSKFEIIDLIKFINPKETFQLKTGSKDLKEALEFWANKLKMYVSEIQKLDQASWDNFFRERLEQARRYTQDMNRKQENP